MSNEIFILKIFNERNAQYIEIIKMPVIYEWCAQIQLNETLEY